MLDSNLARDVSVFNFRRRSVDFIFSERGESRKQRKPGPTHDSRHLPSLSAALDVSGAVL